jgi:DNA-binding NarL/FixJ family response regulator
MKVLLVDDHPLILAALQAVIRGLGDNVTVAAADSASAARAALKQDPDHDLMLLDLELGDADGFELLPQLRSEYPALPIVVVSASSRPSDVIRAIDLGAMGFVPKRATNEHLFEALSMVMSGGIYVPPMTMGSEPSPPPGGDTMPAVMHRVAEAAPTEPHRKPASLDALALTPRQADVLAHLLQGKPNKLIAREMKISVETVKDHVAAVLRALGVSTRTQAVLAVGQMQQERSAGPGWRQA